MEDRVRERNLDDDVDLNIKLINKVDKNLPKELERVLASTRAKETLASSPHHYLLLLARHLRIGMQSKHHGWLVPLYLLVWTVLLPGSQQPSRP